MPTIKLPRLSINWRDQPELFERYWDDAMSSIETTLNAILSIPAIEAALLLLDAATQAAQTAADNANAAAESVTLDTSLQNSYVTGLTLEAFNDGADCHVDISDHFRVYGDAPDIPIPVTGGAFAGIPHDTIVRVYYDQADRSGGVVIYEWSSNIADAAQTGDRHSVGAVVTPRATEMGSIIGSGLNPPGMVIP